MLLALTVVAFLIALSLYRPLAAMLLWLLLAPYSRHVSLDIALGAGIPDLSLTRLMAGWLVVLLIAQARAGSAASTGCPPPTWYTSSSPSPCFSDAPASLGQLRGVPGRVQRLRGAFHRPLSDAPTGAQPAGPALGGADHGCDGGGVRLPGHARADYGRGVVQRQGVDALQRQLSQGDQPDGQPRRPWVSARP